MTDQNESTTPKTPRRKTFKGIVVSDKMNKTVLVQVESRKSHPLYSKIIKTTRKYMVHDHKNESGIGDFVLIEETRPLSKNKRFRLVEILEKAQ